MHVADAGCAHFAEDDFLRARGHDCDPSTGIIDVNNPKTADVFRGVITAAP